MRDAKGKSVPSWARYIVTVAPAGSHDGYTVNGDEIGFGIYCPADATITLQPIDNDSAFEIVLLAGYHPINCKAITTTDVKIHLLYAYDPR